MCYIMNYAYDHQLWTYLNANDFHPFNNCCIMYFDTHYNYYNNILLKLTL